MRRGGRVGARAHVLVVPVDVEAWVVTDGDLVVLDGVTRINDVAEHHLATTHTT